MTDFLMSRTRLHRAAILVTGLILPQVILFGPSLAGFKILLPLDLLAIPNVYLPATSEYARVQPHDFVLADEVFLLEFERRFATSEIRAGRLPLWIPDIYLGAPYVVWDKYSPFNVLYYLLPTPLTLAWLQLLKALVTGAGAYVAFRRLLGVSFWPAAVGAWCNPLTGFFILWQGYPLSRTTAWLPWVLVATDGVVRRPLGWGGPVLAVLTGVVVTTRADVGAQVLLAAGFYALWCLWDAYGSRGELRRALRAGVAVAGAWTLGLLLAAPYLLPLAEYAASGDRLLRRGAGQEERPPAGLSELPRIVLPEVYGSTQYGAHLLTPGNLLESAAGMYTGLLATLLLAPLAWCSPRHRSINTFWVLLCLITLSWTLDVPGLVTLLRSPGLNLLPHNRFVFAGSFALLALAVVGLDVIWQGGPARRWWFVLPIGVVVLLGVWCWDRSTWLPEPLATQLELALRAGQPLLNVPDLAALEQARAHYLGSQTYGVLLCGITLCAWLVVWLGGTTLRWFGSVLATLLVAELLWFARDRNPQCDPALYYPRLPVLEGLAKAPPGRILGVKCLPANLAMSHGLRDVRGYDSIDPKPLVELLDLVRDPRFQPTTFARLQLFVPLAGEIGHGAIRLPPVLNMLNVRYLIFRGTPPPDLRPLLAGQDYWVVENPDALPRVFVPVRVERAPDRDKLLSLLATPDFDPNHVAYVDAMVSLPENCRGTATIVDEIPTRVTIDLDMETSGLVVLSDLWYEGWHAYLDGDPVPILKTDHALRGVVAPAGRSTVVFRYEPASFARGLQGLIVASVGLLVWVAATWLAVRRINSN
jgi:hypothetical protein